MVGFVLMVGLAKKGHEEFLENSTTSGGCFNNLVRDHKKLVADAHSTTAATDFNRNCIFRGVLIIISFLVGKV